MAKKSRKPLQKVTINLYHGDLAELETMYPQLGATVAVREIVHNYIRNINTKVEEPIPPVVSPAMFNELVRLKEDNP